MAQYILINPLQQVLTFEEYKKALKKAEAFMEKNQFSTEEKKTRGRPKGTTKKPQPTEPIEKKPRGRPPKVKSETPVAKAPVGRPAKIDDYTDFRGSMSFNDDFKTQGWFQSEDEITKILKDHFKNTKSIRLQNGMFEVYDDKKGWIIRARISTPEERAEGKGKYVLDPKIVIEDTWDDLVEWGGVPFDWYLTHPDNEKEFEKKKTKIKAIINQFLIKRFNDL
jgi:hypothetical protein